MCNPFHKSWQSTTNQHNYVRQAALCAHRHSIQSARAPSQTWLSHCSHALSLSLSLNFFSSGQNEHKARRGTKRAEMICSHDYTLGNFQIDKFPVKRRGRHILSNSQKTTSLWEACDTKLKNFFHFVVWGWKLWCILLCDAKMRHNSDNKIEVYQTYGREYWKNYYFML